MINTEWNTPTKYIGVVGLILFGIFLLYLSRSVIALLVVAGLIAFLLMPVVNFFRRRLHLSHSVAVLMAYIVFVLIIILAPLVFIPAVINGFDFLAQIDYQILIDGFLQRVRDFLLNLKSLDTQFLGYTISFDFIADPLLQLLEDADINLPSALPSTETIVNSIRSAVSFTFGFATNVAGTVVSSLFTIFLTLLSAIYISLDIYKFSRWIIRTVPALYRPEIAILLSRLRKTWRAYFRGQLYLMFVVGFITWLGALAIGLPGAFPLAIITGILELVPNIGPFLAGVPAVVVALIQGSTYLGVNNFVFALIVIGLYVVIQQLENTFIVPRILGEAVDLPALIIMLGVIVGTNVAGILGALLAAPIVASMREITHYIYAKILGENPFPPSSEGTLSPKKSWKSYFRQIKDWVQEQVKGDHDPGPDSDSEEEAGENEIA